MFPESRKVGCGRDVSQLQSREMEVALEGHTGMCMGLTRHVAHIVSREELNSDPSSTVSSLWSVEDKGGFQRGERNPELVATPINQS